MLNKKLLAAAIAASLSTSAFAAVDLDADTGAEKIATDSIAWNAAVAANAANSAVPISFAFTDNVVVNAGIGIPDGTYFARFDLTNATLGATLVGGALTGTGVASQSLSSGGTDGDDFLIIEFAATSIGATTDLTLALTDLDVDGSTVSISYELYDDLLDAINQNDGRQFATESGTIATFADSITGEFVTPANAVATATTNFVAFDDSATNVDSATTAHLGTLTFADLLGTGFVDLDGTALSRADITETDNKVLVEGNLGFGSPDADGIPQGWSLNDAADCSGTDIPLVVADDLMSAETAVTDFSAAAAHYLCVAVDGEETIADQASNLSVTLTENAITDTAGQTNYDTASIVVPYVTTFDSYNQRIYITNNSSRDAAYTTSFIKEASVEMEPGTAATGTVAANSVTVIRATDLVTITSGPTRVSATIQIEADSESNRYFRR
jgi:hypothetical protein